MTNVYEMSREEFRAELEKRPSNASQIYVNAPVIYGWLAGYFGQLCNDSVLREWSFEWASEKLNVDYDVIYERWLTKEFMI